MAAGTRWRARGGQRAISAVIDEITVMFGVDWG
jgi:hypothetical protein